MSRPGQAPAPVFSVLERNVTSWVLPSLDEIEIFRDGEIYGVVERGNNMIAAASESDNDETNA
jgi:hypothetical protein